MLAGSKLIACTQRGLRVPGVSARLLPGDGSQGRVHPHVSIVYSIVYK